jgi:O-antigen/teichoic acid export membrane protein
MTEVVSAEERPVAIGGLALLVSEAATAFLALIAGAVVARELGPGGKGDVSTLSYVVAIMTTLAALGLGEAGITLVNQGKATLRTALDSTIRLLIPATLIAAAFAGLLTLAPFIAIDGSPRWALLATALSVIPITITRMLALFLDSQRRLVFAAALRTSVAVVSMVATVSFVVLFGWRVSGAIAAPGVGALPAMVVALVVLRRASRSDGGSASASYLRVAVPLGVPVMAAYVLVSLAARVDLLLVRGMIGADETGYYSIALTLSQLTTYASASLVGASYPYSASLSDTEATTYLARLSRNALAAATLSAVALAVVLPFLIPLAFGEVFRPAIGPALLLLVAAVLYTQQLAIARTWAARGRTNLLLLACALTLVIMVALDVALLPHFELMGAAMAAVISQAVGTTAVVLITLRELPELRLRDLLPTWRDYRDLFAFMRGLVRRSA